MRPRPFRSIAWRLKFWAALCITFQWSTAQPQPIDEVDIAEFQSPFVCFVPGVKMDDPRGALQRRPGNQDDLESVAAQHEQVSCVDRRTGSWQSTCRDGVCWRETQEWDRGLAASMGMLLVAEGASSIVDFGCGAGKHLDVFRALDIGARGLEGDRAVASEPRQIMTQDLTATFQLADCCDWAMTIEVAEHIPVLMEHRFLDNLHRHNKRGVILSWSIRGQHGLGHINNRNSLELINLFRGMGYVHDVETQSRLRASAQQAYLKQTLYVFRKLEHRSLSLDELRRLVRDSHLAACFPSRTKEAYYVAWHVAWKQVEGLAFIDLLSATAAFEEKHDGPHAAILLDRSFNELRYYGEDGARAEVLVDFEEWSEKQKNPAGGIAHRCCGDNRVECFQMPYSFTFEHCCTL